MSYLQEADTTFAELLKELPPNLESQAREFRAFTRARVIKSPTQLLRLVFLHCGAEVIVRFKLGGMRLQTPDGKPLDLEQALRRSTEQVVTVPAQFEHQGKTISVWVHAYHLTEEEANRARQRCYRKANKNSRPTPNPDKPELNRGKI